MLFKVERTSHYEHNCKPNEQCKEITVENDSGEEIKAWGIEVNTPEELIKFKNDVKEKIIIREWYENRAIPVLEIYDDYRE